MLQCKTFLYNLLSTDATILSLVGTVDHIYFGYPNSFSELPALAYNEDNQVATFWNDNLPQDAQSSITIDVYTLQDVSTSPLVTAVESALLANLYTITFSSDVYDPDLKIQHRAIKANRKFTADDLDGL